MKAGREPYSSVCISYSGLLLQGNIVVKFKLGSRTLRTDAMGNMTLRTEAMGNMYSIRTVDMHLDMHLESVIVSSCSARIACVLLATGSGSPVPYRACDSAAALRWSTDSIANVSSKNLRPRPSHMMLQKSGTSAYKVAACQYCCCTAAVNRIFLVNKQPDTLEIQFSYVGGTPQFRSPYHSRPNIQTIRG